MFLAIKIYIDHVAGMARDGGAMGGGKQRDQL